MRLALVSLVLLLATGVAANPDDDASAPGQPAAVTAESHFNQGQALARQSDWAGAEQAYREATRVRPAFPEAWNGLGHALRKRGKFEESVKAYQEALQTQQQLAKRFPGDAGLQQQLATTYRNLGALWRELKEHPQSHQKPQPQRDRRERHPGPSDRTRGAR